MLTTLARSGTATSFGVPAALGLVLCCEAGLPVPLPADVMLLALGAAVSAGDLSWWAAVLGLELAALVGTGALLLMARGPASAVVTRLGPRIGLTADRLQRSSSLLEHRGLPALVAGRTTPGLRTITVVAAASSTVPVRRALPALLVGSTVFLQGHLVLGLAVGAPLRAALATGRGRLVVAAAVVFAVGVAVALARTRRGRGGERAWSDGICPACLTVTYLSRPSTGVAGPPGSQPSGPAVPPRG